MKNLSEADLQLLEDYWNGRLEPNQRTELEQRLRDEPGFQQAATEWRLLITEGFAPTNAEARELADIKSRLRDYGKPEREEDPPANNTGKRAPTVRRLYLGLAAAAAVLLLFLFTPLGDIFGPNDPYEHYFAHLPRDNANLSNEAEDGKRAYDQQDYATAYPALMAEVAAGGDSLDLIYAGVAAIGSGQAEKAIPLLEQLLRSNNWQLYDSEIRWYLALAYLREEQAIRALALLEALAEADGPYATEARSLLDQME